MEIIKPAFVVQQQGVLLRLPPGFRFHPTDEELVVQYLKKKIFSCPLPASIIPEIDLGKYDPWDLPGGVVEGEKYYFTQNRNGGRPKRAAGGGFWKVKGKDKPVIMASGQVVGMKKVMVFHRGKPCHGKKSTDWIMHEYSLQTNSMLNVRDWVVCRVFKKKMHGGGIMTQQSDNRIGVVNLGPSPASSCVTDLTEGSSTDGDEGNSSTMHAE